MSKLSAAFRIILAVFFILFLVPCLRAQDAESSLIIKPVKWDKIDDAFGYLVEVEKEEDGEYVKYITEFVDEPFIILSLPPGTYRHRESAYDVGDNLNEPTEWDTFKLDPRDISDVLLTWPENEGAEHYEVVVEKEEDEEYLELIREFTEETFLQLPLLPGIYQFNVVPWDLSKPLVQEPEWMKFDLAAPVSDETEEMTEDIIIVKYKPEVDETGKITEGDIIPDKPEQDSLIPYFALNRGWGVSNLSEEGAVHGIFLDTNFRFLPWLSAGVKGGVNISTGNISAMEMQTYARFLGSGTIQSSPNLLDAFVQFGMGLLKTSKEDSDSHSSFLLDHTTGVSVPLFSNWHIEPSFRVGVVFMADGVWPLLGVTITAGYKTPLEYKMGKQKQTIDSIEMNEAQE